MITVLLCLQDDPLKSSMHSFLMTNTNQQEVASLDAKVRGYETPKHLTMTVLCLSSTTL